MFIGESESLSFAMMGSVVHACVYPCISALPAIVNALTQRPRYYSSLGVHISFVRSVAMDSWNPKQLLLMKAGGNAKCAAFLSQKGVPATTPIKQKYESPAAQLYKEVLRARVEGTPEPTELPKASNPTNSSTGSQQSHQDPNGLQRLLGETDDQYIIRQTRLKEEARQRMALKFGGNGQQGSRMAGIGSDPNYGNGGNSGGIDSLVSGFGSALSTFGSFTATAAQNASSLISDPSTHRQLSALGGSVTAAGSSLWSSFGSSINSVVGTDTESDGFSELQRQMASQRTGNSKYSGFGSDSMTMNGGTAAINGGAMLQEAPGMPGEDRNGIERLSGESDEQYVMRQTRLRDEAKARMAAKFGSGGLSSAGPSSYSAAAPSSFGFAQKPTTSAPSSTGIQPTGSITPPRLAPSSGTYIGQKPTVQKMKVNNADDFFASFGS